MEIRKIPIEQLNPAAYNPRKDLQPGDPEYEKLKRSIQEFDLVEPLVWNERTGRLVGGHQRLKVLQELGYEEVEVSVVDLPEEKEKALNIALNKISGDWDNEKLKDLLEELDTGDFDIELTGFGMDEIEDLMTQFHVPGEIIEDDVPEPPDEPITKPGDLWILGRHRLLCGDSTNMEDVEKLMDGKKANAVLTDPPYGQNQPGVPNDKPEELRTLIEDAVKWLPVENAAIVAFQSPRTFPVLLDALRNNNIKFERMLWMCKDAQCTYPWRGWIMKSEAILVASKGYPHWNDVKPYVHDTYRLPEVSGELPVEIGWHGSVKPQAVIQDILKRISYENDIVFDGFGGSGSTLIACEQLNRICYMMEIDPIYCDVIIKRWENLTGQKAVLAE